MTIVATGPLCTVQDRGRPGWFHAGVGVSGAADRESSDLANRLVANDPSAAGLECLLGGLEFTVDADVVIAVTGAPAPLTVDSVPMGHASVVHVGAGSLVTLRSAPYGLRTYVAVRGGVDVESVLGSRSHDTMSGIGPPPLEPGTVLPVGGARDGWPELDVAPLPAMTSEPVVAHVVSGPRDDWFDNADDLYTGRWTVTDRTDRVGARLERPTGAGLRRRAGGGELATEGMALGAIQVPPSGEPVVFLADHPITGGYPVVGTVVARDVSRIAQARPGQEIRFVRHIT